jgi:hypothetical protein
LAEKSFALGIYQSQALKWQEMKDKLQMAR